MAAAVVAAAVAPLRVVVAAEVEAVRPARPARVEEVAVVAELRAHLASVAPVAVAAVPAVLLARAVAVARAVPRAAGASQVAVEPPAAGLVQQSPPWRLRRRACVLRRPWASAAP